MDKLSRLISRYEENGVYWIEGRMDIPELRAACSERTVEVFIIQGSGVHDKDTFFHALGKGLRFPDYFGNNWDAAYDCLTDMQWHDCLGMVILYEDSQTLEQSSPEEWKNAVALFKDAARYWGDQETVFIILLRRRDRTEGRIRLIPCETEHSS